MLNLKLMLQGDPIVLHLVRFHDVGKSRFIIFFIIIYLFYLNGTMYSSNINVTTWCTVPDYSYKLIHICSPLAGQNREERDNTS